MSGRPERTRGEHSANMDFREINTRNRIVLSDITLDGVDVSGSVVITMGEGGKRNMQMPDGLSRNDPAFLELMALVDAQLDMHNEEGESVRTGDLPPLGEHARDDGQSGIDADRTEQFLADVLAGKPKRLATVPDMIEMLTELLNSGVQRLIDAGEMNEKDVAELEESTRDTIRLLEKHESRIEPIEIEGDSIDERVIGRALAEIEVCEMAERLNVEREIARLTLGYMMDRKGVEKHLRECVENTMMTHEDSRQALKMVQDLAVREMPGYVKRKLGAIAHGIAN